MSAPSKLDDLLDGLVAEYAERVARSSDPAAEDLLARVPGEHRPALERCFRTIRAGLAHAPRASQALIPGVEIGPYVLERELGRGGMSFVWLARDPKLRRSVALKLLRPALAVEPQHVQRFEREGLAIARLQHPHIVRVYAVGEDAGWHWIAMEHVPGVNLAQVYAAAIAAQRDPRRWNAETLMHACGFRAKPWKSASWAGALCELLSPAVRAVGVAHEIGLVHRDLKPSNILVHEDGRALVADFGLAKGEGDPGLSLSGEPIGTPYYMSPEQASFAGRRIDARSDIYSLGVTLFEGLTGRRPFEGDSALQVLERIKNEAPPAISQLVRGVSREVEAVVDQAMSREPSDRYPTALDFSADLVALAEDRLTQAASRRGGEWRRFRRALRESAHGRPVEYKTRAHVFGMPLVHAFFGPRRAGQRMRVATGWIAFGEVANGGLAIGGNANGVLACGGMASGGIAFGGVAVGVLPFGGLAIGLLAFGGVAFGFGAVGGVAKGVYALGGKAYGKHVVTAARRDPEAVEFFGRWTPPWLFVLGESVLDPSSIRPRSATTK